MSSSEDTSAADELSTMSSANSPEKAYTNLVALRAIGAINDREFEIRRKQLVDALTGTSFNGSPTGYVTGSDYQADRLPTTAQTSSDGSGSGSTDSAHSTYSASSYTTASTSSNFFSSTTESDPEVEAAVRLDYCADDNTWKQCETMVQVERKPFSKGNMRQAFRMREAWPNHPWFVAKRYYDKDTGKLEEETPLEDYFSDVVMQAVAAEWAARYNQEHPPKGVNVIKTWLVRMLDRPGKPYYACEPYMEGQFRKHNNNGGWKSADERSTPQAFSHYSYEKSGGTLMIVDIQGVDDYYTDPQIHSIDGNMFSSGNFGVEGFDDFFRTHECSTVCAYLGLKLRGKLKPSDEGTQINPERLKRRLEKQHERAAQLQAQLDKERTEQLNSTVEDLGSVMQALVRARAAQPPSEEYVRDVYEGDRVQYKLKTSSEIGLEEAAGQAERKGKGKKAKKGGGRKGKRSKAKGKKEKGKKKGKKKKKKKKAQKSPDTDDDDEEEEEDDETVNEDANQSPQKRKKAGKSSRNGQETPKANKKKWNIFKTPTKNG